MKVHDPPLTIGRRARGERKVAQCCMSKGGHQRSPTFPLVRRGCGIPP
jgi:hypothetical protein